ncbi:heme ABC transporter ATP-binding protein [Paraflavitalea sp. CAU 1676]|uniref:heme ABC transporter ATP-binding protein n=1 Tax=Paraflavitalea sp. CAU 1676 TaxID=3032598 RepID=UPI0023D9B9BE|nr:heme ABC transporter ATP-binding protein [Paraflavitalea sp. CAU 1676]MDF2187152.1 heme ABC transporter ATP-binding protein [Paraflavitalea sp. CAU 1676]
MITARNISFKLGQKTILNKLAFSLQPGELSIVLGQNGAGKSTLLKILSGEQKPTDGMVLLGQDDLHKLSPAQLAHQRAVLSQQYPAALPFTTEEIVMMGRYPHFGSKPAAFDKEVVHECMEEMQVLALSRRSYQTLSGGEQQRVQMARVLSQLKEKGDTASRKLLLLDEPTASMDCLHQQLCLRKAKELAGRGYSVLVILHDLNLAAQFADTILLMKHGRLVAHGGVREVLQPVLIAEAYDMEVNVLEYDEYDFPILVPAAHKSKPVLIRAEK